MVKYYRFRKILDQEAKEVTRKYRYIINSLKNKLDLDREVTIYILSSTNSPMVSGVFRCKIYLPEMHYHPTELQHIIAHEMIHFKEGDILKKMIFQFFQLMFWWNPVFRILNHDLEQMIEIRTDKKVIEFLSKDEEESYLSTLLNCLKYSRKKSREFRPVYNYFAEGHSNESIRQRFGLIMDTHKYSTKTSVLISVAFLVSFHIACSFMMGPSYSPPEVKGEWSGEAFGLRELYKIIEEVNPKYVIRL